MAVTASTYGNAAKHLGNGDVVWKASGGSDIRVALVTNSYSFDRDAHDNWGSTGVSTNEIAAGSGYTAGGASLSLADPSYDSASDESRFASSAGTLVWSSATITAYGAIVYKYNATPANAYLLCYINFGGAVSCTSSTFTITWGATGIMKITAT